MLFSQKILAEEQKNDFSCLTREQKEAIAVCYKENYSCHQNLKAKSDVLFEPQWGAFVGVLLIGVISGMSLEHKISR